MRIRSVVHEGLRRFVEQDDASGLPATYVEQIRNIVSFLQDMGDVAELRDVPGFRPNLRRRARPTRHCPPY